MNTAQSIMDALQSMAERKEPIAPQMWMEAAGKINVLLQDEQDKLAEAEHVLAIKRAELIGAGQTSAATKILIEADPMYLECRKQKGLIDRAVETIRIAKKNATLASELIRNNLD